MTTTSKTSTVKAHHVDNLLINNWKLTTPFFIIIVQFSHFFDLSVIKNSSLDGWL